MWLQNKVAEGKGCYLKLKNIRKVLAIENRDFEDPVIYKRPESEKVLPCPFNCGAEFSLTVSMFAILYMINLKKNLNLLFSD